MLQVTRLLLFLLLGALLGVARAAPQGGDTVLWLLEEPVEQQLLELSDAALVGPQEVQRALRSYQADDFRTAAHILEKAVALNLPDGNNDFLSFVLAESYRMLKLNAQAVQQYESILQRFSQSSKRAPALLRLLSFAYESRQSSRADSLFNLFHAEHRYHPLYPSAQYLMGKLYYRTERFGEGYQILIQIDKKSSRHMQGQFLAALCYGGVREWDKALTLLQYVATGAQEDELKAEATIAIGDIYRIQGNFDMARKFYAAVSMHAQRFELVQIKIVRTYLDSRDYQKASALARQWLNQNGSSEHYFEMASLLGDVYKGMGDEEQLKVINAKINQQIQSTRLAYEVNDELNGISAQLQSWQLIDLQAIRSGDAPTRAVVGKAVERLREMQLELLALLAKLGVSGAAGQRTVLAGRVERRYLGMLRDSVDIGEGLIKDIRGQLELLQYTPSDKRDSLWYVHRGHNEDSLQALEAQNRRFGNEIELVIRECLGEQQGDGRIGEERQVRYVDWTFANYLKHKQDFAALSTAATHSDSLAASLQNSLSSAAAETLLVSTIQSERNRLIEHIRALLDLYPRSMHTGALLFRLAELLHDGALDAFDTRLREYERKLALGSADSAGFPDIDLGEVVEVYERIDAVCTGCAVNDDALFFKALALQKMGDDAGAIAVLKKLVETFTESEYFVEANMKIGRYYFDNPSEENNRGYDMAEDAFRKVLFYRDHPQFVQALYHLGWCYYMKDRYEEAIAVFKYLVEEVKLDFNPLKQEEQQVLNPLLREEAVDYIAISFDEESRLEDAISFLALIGNSDYAALVLKRMGELRAEDLDYSGAVTVYNRLFEEYPTSAAAPDAAINLITLYEIMNQPQLGIVERERFFERYCRGSAWQQVVSRMDSGVVARVDSMALVLGLYVGDSYYRQAEKSGEEALFRQALKSYSRMAERYPGDRRAAEALWNLAVILDARLKEYKTAYRHYIAYSRMETLDSASRQQAALNAIALTQKVMPPDSTLQPGIMDSAALKLVDAVDNYCMLFPQGAERARVLLTLGGVYFNRKMYDNAALVYLDVIDNTDQGDHTHTARLLLGQCLFAQQKWTAAAAQFALIWNHSAQPGQRDEAYKMLLQSLFLDARGMMQAQHYAQAAAAFVNIERDYKGSEYSDIVLFNAAEAYEKLKLWERACDVYLRLVSTYPSSKLAADALFNAASGYEQINRYQQSADTYERLVALFPAHDKARDALFNLGLSYEKLGHVQKMAEANERYSLRYPQEKDAVSMMLRSANYYFKAAMLDKARSVLLNFTSKFPEHSTTVEALCMLGEIAAVSGDTSGAHLNFAAAERLNSQLAQQGGETNSFFAAEAAFKSSCIHDAQCRSIAFTLPADIFKKQQERKSKLLADAVKGFERTVGYRSERMFEAAFKIGSLYEHFAHAWLHQQRPRLDPINASVFEKDVFLLSASLLQKALGPYQKTIELSQGFDSLGSQQSAIVDSARTHLSEGYFSAGRSMVRALEAMHTAPLPKDIRDKPLYSAQYQQKLLETFEPLKQQTRDYFQSAFRVLDSLKLGNAFRDSCLQWCALTNYQLGNDFDQLASQILRNTSSLSENMDVVEREDLLFGLEDIVFELQDHAIAQYESALDFARTQGLHTTLWYTPIIKELARLSPEAYGSLFFQPLVVASDNQWFVRADSIDAWTNAAAVRHKNWQVASVNGSTRLSRGEASRLSFTDSTTTTRYFWKPFVISGTPRDGALEIKATAPYKAYLNGVLILSDTTYQQEPAQDSAAGITSHFKPGDNILAIELSGADSLKPSVAALVWTLVDTSVKVQSTLQLSAEMQDALQKTLMQARAVNESAPQQSSPAQQPVPLPPLHRAPMLQSAEPVQKSLSNYQQHESLLQKKIRSERLELQKVKSQVDAVDMQKNAVLKEIELLRSGAGRQNK